MENFKKDFPLLRGSNIAYLDNAATSQRPCAVLEAERDYYEKCNANPFRGLYGISIEATDRYEEARERVRAFLNAPRSEEIIFTRNTTESINLAAYSYGLNHLKEGDEILVTIAEHHSNLLPWQMVARQTGASLVFLECGRDGVFGREKGAGKSGEEAEKAAAKAIEKAVTPRTKLAAVTEISNVLGRRTPLEQLIHKVHEQGGVVLVDGAQSAPHIPVDVQKLDADFFAFSGHKLMAPMGIGVLYGRKELLDEMPPFLTGGDMIDSVTRQGAVFAALPHKFEAGTVNGAGAAALKAALDYLDGIGFETVRKQEEYLTGIALEEMRRIPGVEVLGGLSAEEHCGIISFTLEGVHPHDISSILDADGVAVRAGHHCAQPLLTHLGVMTAARASISFYNTEEDVERFLSSLKQVRRKMGYGK